MDRETAGIHARSLVLTGSFAVGGAPRAAETANPPERRSRECSMAPSEKAVTPIQPTVI